MPILETIRLSLHQFQRSDASFLLEVMNQPAYHRDIGDRGLRSVVDAEIYIEEKLVSEYKKRGFGFWMIRLKDTMVPVGFTGLILRAELDKPDVGYAIHEAAAGKGYAEEATRGVLKYVREFLHFPLVYAISDPDNKASINVLLKCGFHFEKQTRVFTEEDELNIYKIAL